MRNETDKTSGLQIIGRRGISGFVELMLNIGLIAGIILLIAMPAYLRYFLTDLYYSREISGSYYNFILIFLMFTGALMLYIVFEIRRIFTTINSNAPFSPSNVVSLRHISRLCLTLFILYLIKSVVFFTPFTVILALFFAVVWVFMLVLSEVFRQAVEAKQENDLTI